MDKYYSPVDYESVTVANTVIGLTASKYLDSTNGKWLAEKALITVETAEIRFRIDGSNPTTSEGHDLVPGQSIVLDNSDQLLRFRAIRVGSTSGVIKVTYYK